MVVEASPAAALVVTEADLLLELLVVALDAPAQLGLVDEVGERCVSGRVESQYLVGSLSPFGHSIRNHSSGRGAMPE